LTITLKIIQTASVERRTTPTRRASAIALVAGVIGVAGCGANPTETAPSTRLEVVAASATWGAIASDLGAGIANVQSIINSPAVDPHEYEPSAADARAIDRAAVVVMNGLGYDAWASRVVRADPRSGRIVVSAETVLGRHTGDNPHRWYDPADVSAVADAITAAYRSADPAHAADYAVARQRFADGLRDFRSLVASIRATYAGTPIGASESVITPLADALELPVITPGRFLTDISDGIDPSPGDTETIDRQIRTHAIAAYVYNPQNATPEVARFVAASRAAGIEVVTMTESLPADHTSFATWQVAQLRALIAALQTARTGRRPTPPAT
jgi:zinc/manganese transport system substrate-binding protein